MEKDLEGADKMKQQLAVRYYPRIILKGLHIPTNTIRIAVPLSMVILHKQYLSDIYFVIKLTTLTQFHEHLKARDKTSLLKVFKDIVIKKTLQFNVITLFQFPNRCFPIKNVYALPVYKKPATILSTSHSSV
jgi:hypothetical protein